MPVASMLIPGLSMSEDQEGCHARHDEREQSQAAEADHAKDQADPFDSRMELGGIVEVRKRLAGGNRHFEEFAKRLPAFPYLIDQKLTGRNGLPHPVVVP